LGYYARDLIKIGIEESMYKRFAATYTPLPFDGYTRRRSSRQCVDENT
jgi:hypothetical protein